MTLGRKQDIADPAAWQAAAEQAREQVSDSELDQLADRAAERVAAAAAAGRIGYGWSGGKDSQVLRYVMDLAGVGDCLLAMTEGLEWPAMLRWQTDHMPAGCEIRTVPLDLSWLAAHPQMLFPQGPFGPRWFSLVQHAAQRAWFRDLKLDRLVVGRRRKDGNYIGRDGQDCYTNGKGVTYWSPLADWTHEQVLALIVREHLPLPPCYSWPRGYQVGTGAWPARQWCASMTAGFEECWQIDPDVIRTAAEVLPQAAGWMRATGRS